jgi:putative DNA methylase
MKPTDKTFIETQFPVSLISKESYKERKANYSQTLTGLGKWWGRKPLILIRASILGMLMPAGNNPQKDRDIFLKILTMDVDGLWQRRSKAIPVKTLYDWLQNTTDKHVIPAGMPESSHRDVNLGSGIEPKLSHRSIGSLPSLALDSGIHAGMTEPLFTLNAKGGVSWTKGTTQSQKDAITRRYFDHLSYDEKLEYCDRPEQIEGPSETAWQEINAHLGTTANNIQQLIDQLGTIRFGHTPKVGDAFCGGVRIPVQRDHSFQANAATHSVLKQPLIPVNAATLW